MYGAIPGQALPAPFRSGRRYDTEFPDLTAPTHYGWRRDEEFPDVRDQTRTHYNTRRRSEEPDDSWGPFRGAQTFRGMAPRIGADLQRDFGLDRESAAAILGNLGHESAGFTAHQERNPRGGGRGGAGWAQWTGPRRRQFEAWAAQRGLDPKSYEANYGFLKHELQGSHRGSLDAVRRAGSLESKTIAFERSYEGAAADAKHYGSRYRYAREAMGLPRGQPGDGNPAVAGAERTQGLAAGAAGTAADNAARLLGAGSSQAASALGSRMTPGQWCADFVNGALKSAGIRGVNSSIANSFLGWGREVMDGVQKGDVIVEHRGRGNGQTGGHAGIATGRVETDRQGRQRYEMVSGNHGNRVGRSWVYADQVAVRRSAEQAAEQGARRAAERAEGTAGARAQEAERRAQRIGEGFNPTRRQAGGETPTAYRGAGDNPAADGARRALAGRPGQFDPRGEGARNGSPGLERDLGDGMTGTGFNRADAASLARQSPAERLAQAAPPMPRGAGAGTGGARGPSMTPTFHIHGAGNPEETANAVQRRISETQGYLTHDLQFEGI